MKFLFCSSSSFILIASLSSLFLIIIIVTLVSAAAPSHPNHRKAIYLSENNNTADNGTNPLKNITWSTLNGCSNEDGKCAIQAYSDLPSHSYAAYRVPLDASSLNALNIDVVVNLEAESICEEAVYVQWKLQKKPDLLPWRIPPGGDDDDDDSNAPDLMRALLVLPLEKSLMCNTQPDIQKSFKKIVPAHEYELFVIVQSRSAALEPYHMTTLPPAPHNGSDPNNNNNNLTTVTQTPAPTTLYPAHHYYTPSPASSGGNGGSGRNQKCAVNLYINMERYETWRSYSLFILLGSAFVAVIFPVIIIFRLASSTRNGDHQVYLVPLRRLMYVNVLMFFPSVIFFFFTKWVTTGISKTYECGKKSKCISDCCCPRKRIVRKRNAAPNHTSSSLDNQNSSSMENIQQGADEGTTSSSPSTTTNATTAAPTTTTTAAAASSSEVEEDDIVCRICFDGDEEEDLLQPCNCTGSSAYIHQSCLDKWRVQSSNQRVQRAASCEICLAPFRIPVSRAAVVKMVALRVLYFFSFFISAYAIITLSFAFEAFVVSPMTCTAPYEHSFVGPLSDFQTYVVGALTYMVVSFCLYIATQIAWFIWFNVPTPMEADPRDENGNNNNNNEENLLAAERERMQGAAAFERGEGRRQNAGAAENNNNNDDNNNQQGEAVEEEERQVLLANEPEEQQVVPPARHSPRTAENNNDNNNNNNNDDQQAAAAAPAAAHDNGNNNNNNENGAAEEPHRQAEAEEEEDVPAHVRRIRDYAERQRARPVNKFFHSWKVLFVVLGTLLWELSLLVFICFYYKWLVYNHRTDYAWSWGIPFPVMIIVVMFVSFLTVLIVVIRALILRCINDHRQAETEARREENEEAEQEREIEEEQANQRRQENGGEEPAAAAADQQPRNNNNNNENGAELEAAAPQVAVD